MNNRLADDIGPLARSGPELQEIATHIDETSIKFGIMINAEKTKTMIIEMRKDISISINTQGEGIDQVEQFG